MELILVRHPQPDLAPGLCYGSSDVAVAANVLEQAQRQLTPLLRPALDGGMRLVASPLQRCAALAARLGPFDTDARLAEMHFGAWELQPWDAIPRAEVDAWAADLLDYRPGGGESVNEVAARVRAFLDELTHDAVLLCHAGTIRLIAAMAAGEPLLQAAAKPNQIKYCAMQRLSWPAKPV